MSQPPATPTGRRVAALCLLVASTALSFGLAEVVFRVLARGAYRQAIDSYANPLYQIADGEPYFYRLEPGSSGSKPIGSDGGDHGEWSFTINAEGFRAPTPALADIPADHQRVLFLGDSFTFGMGVEDNEGFVALVEDGLEEQGIPAVAINAGIPGYNSVQQLHLLRELFDSAEPDLVVLGYVLNDSEPVHVVPLPPEETYKYCGSWLWEEVRLLANRLGELLVSDDPLFVPRKLSSESNPLAGFRWGSPKWPASRDALIAMHQLCEQRGVPFVVFVLPFFTSDFDASYPYRLIHDRVTALGQEQGFTAIDLLPDLLGRDYTKLFLPADGHPNRDGQAILATSMLRELAPLLSR